MPPLPRRAVLFGAVSLAASAQQAFASTGVVGAVVGSGGGGCSALPPGLAIEVGQIITTCNSEIVNLLFDDGTSVTLGPDSAAVIDHFHVDPGSGDIRMVLRLLRGVFHFIHSRVIPAIRARVQEIHNRLELIHDIRARRHELRLETPGGVLIADDTIATVSVIGDVAIALVAQGKMTEIPLPMEVREASARGPADGSVYPHPHSIVIFTLELLIAADILWHQTHGFMGAEELNAQATRIKAKIAEKLLADAGQKLRSKVEADRLANDIFSGMVAQLQSVKRVTATPLQMSQTRDAERADQILVESNTAISPGHNAVIARHLQENQSMPGAARSTAARQGSAVQKVSSAISSRPYQANLPPRQ